MRIFCGLFALYVVDAPRKYRLSDEFGYVNVVGDVFAWLVLSHFKDFSIIAFKNSLVQEADHMLSLSLTAGFGPPLNGCNGRMEENRELCALRCKAPARLMEVVSVSCEKMSLVHIAVDVSLCRLLYVTKIC